MVIKLKHKSQLAPASRDALRATHGAPRNELGILIAEMVHEFQTPIAIVKNNIEILAANANSVACRRAARTAHATLDRLSRLATATLAAARFQFARPAFPAMAVDIAALIEETYDDCADLALDRNIAFTVASEESVENALVKGDWDKLKEVLLNLISNALKYTPRGGTVSLTAKYIGGHGTEPAHILEIAVEDTGVGIARENLSHIFERFYRIPSDSYGIGDEHAKGTGLGLHISQQIVEAHGGTLEVVSDLGRGSRFVIRLPTAQRQSSPQAQENVVL